MVPDSQPATVASRGPLVASAWDESVQCDAVRLRSWQSRAARGQSCLVWPLAQYITPACSPPAPTFNAAVLRKVMLGCLAFGDNSGPYTERQVGAGQERQPIGSRRRCLVCTVTSSGAQCTAVLLR